MALLPYHLMPTLECAGDFVSLDGILSEDKIVVGRMEYILPDHISYHIDLSHVESGIVVSGTISATVIGVCARCLEPTTFQIEGEIEGFFVFSEEDKPDGLDPDEFDVVTPDGVIELSDSIRAALIFEIPVVLLCDDGCRGLCPQCGTNLNNASCDCARQSDYGNPFSVLKDIDFPSEK
jgi:uncharacterized protein